MKVLGADIGFGYTKATDGKQYQVFKSIVGEANEAQFGESLLPGVPQFPRHIAIGNQSYFVGELAEQQSRGRGFTLDQNQFLAQYAKPLALTALAPFVASGDPVRLVTGLPISFFRRYKDPLTTLLQQRHTVTVVKPGTGEREEKVINVEKVRVIPQPFGSMFNLMLNDIGKPASQRFITEKIGIIDIGFRTADYTISDKTRYSERGSQSSDSGIAVAYTAIANVLQEKSGVNVELYRLYEGVSRGTIKIKGKRYDLTGLVQQAFQQLATRIAQEVNRLWSDDWDLDAIVITGGGGAALSAYLAPLLEGEVLPMPADQDARLNNVHGYWKYGLHLWGA
ncbi:plasmid segregation protein ParM [Fontimonas thermophila]|uniref:Plasmid segregation protein ParM n=1 Tax=Fontimonas thermophila TaxID=1076937 RepID=A0A1I2JBH6_9GAMM|nr:ParM/StbA family protein [Fontimonas thermophila]SFF51183.1 plasmid segregation protein ParM [Fontimonas thermophila]